MHRRKGRGEAEGPSSNTTGREGGRGREKKEPSTIRQASQVRKSICVDFLLCKCC